MRVVELDEVDRPGHKKPASLSAPSPSPPKAGMRKVNKAANGLVRPVLVRAVTLVHHKCDEASNLSQGTGAVKKAMTEEDINA